MNKVLTTEEAVKTSKKLREQKKIIVLAGGCFDILHPGHITFLEKAKQQGDILIILLENDRTLKEKKGIKRPINTQKDRAFVLSAIEFIDYIILLPTKFLDKDYDELAVKLKPAIIATTKADSEKHHKVRQANLINAKVVEVTERIMNHSTTNLIKNLEKL